MKFMKFFIKAFVYTINIYATAIKLIRVKKNYSIMGLPKLYILYLIIKENGRLFYLFSVNLLK